MVVARKAPTTPAPTGSRTPSTQALPKVKKAEPLPKSTQSPLSPPPLLPANGSVKRGRKREKRRRGRSRSWSQQLFLAILTCFAAFAFSVCPTDHPRTSLVCHSLDYYRTYILDPYILPPIASLLRQAEPHVAPLKPYVGPAVSYSRKHIAPPLAAVAHRVVEAVRIHVIPTFYQYYYMVLLPNYYLRIHPLIHPYTSPYISYYRRHILPVLHTGSTYAHTSYARAGPIVRATFNMGRRYAVHTYDVSKPHVHRAWVGTRPHLLTLLEVLRAFVIRIVKTVGNARRVYVDPHLRRIWEQAAEKKAKASQESGWATDLETPPVTEKPVASLPTPAMVSDKVLSDSKSEFTALSLAQSSLSTSSDYADSTDPKHEAASATSIVTKSMHVSNSGSTATHSSPSRSTEATMSAYSTSPSPSTDPESAKSAGSITTESPHHLFAGVQAQDSDSVKNENIDDFLHDIGFGIDDQLSDAPGNEAETEEKASVKEERPKRIPKVRSEIVTRHARWERQLQEFVKEEESKVRQLIVHIRGQAVAQLAQLGGSSSDQEQLGKREKEPAGVVDVVEEAAQRLMKGLEKYAHGLEGRMKDLTNGKEIEKEGQTWEMVVEKTEVRFTGRVKQVQNEVAEWYSKVRGVEQEEVEKSTRKVRAFAQNAQTDLAMDYAWLDDVSYEDWQRYNDLVRVSDDYAIFVRALQSKDYSAPSAHAASKNPLEDSLLSAMNKVELGVNDIAEGFRTLVSDVKRKIGRVLRDADEMTRNTKTREDLGREGGRSSILPVEPSQISVPASPGEGMEEGVDKVLLGRSKEEVEGRLNAAFEAGVRVEPSNAEERDEL